jgi:uncharacterized protein YjbJ (UPF0337 family)
MNWVELTWNWKGNRAVVMTRWPKLTGDELNRIDGRRDELAASLRKFYGYGEDEAEQAISSFEKEIRFPGTAIW